MKQNLKQQTAAEKPRLDPETGKPYPPVRTERFVGKFSDLEFQTPVKPEPDQK